MIIGSHDRYHMDQASLMLNYTW